MALPKGNEARDCVRIALQDGAWAALRDPLLYELLALVDAYAAPFLLLINDRPVSLAEVSDR